jgi:hypothetical protein
MIHLRIDLSPCANRDRIAELGHSGATANLYPRAHEFPPVWGDYVVQPSKTPMISGDGGERRDATRTPAKEHKQGQAIFLGNMPKCRGRPAPATPAAADLR